MKQVATAGNQATGKKRASESVARGRHVDRGAFTKVRDKRNHPIRGLWKRGNRFYGQMRVEDPSSGQKVPRRIPLGDEENPVVTVAQALAAMAKLKTDRSREVLKITKRGKRLFAFVEDYLAFSRKAKSVVTAKKETTHLNAWKKFLGDVPLKSINKGAINRFRENLLDRGHSPRTVNLYVITLRQLLKHAEADDLIAELPFRGLKPLKVQTKQRRYIPPADIEHLAECALAIEKTGQQLSDFIRLLLYCGSREGEARRLRWDDINFERGQMALGSEGDAKNREWRTVDFNPQLEAHLLDLQTRQQPDSQWVFPSVQRGRRDIHVKTFKGALKLAKENAATHSPALADFGFHDCRHTFISVCVMAGIDFMTIAKWVGHKDGGVLIGKVYGHLANEHRKRMAEKVQFSPTVLKEARAHETQND